jgi:hypothetical protein
MKNAKVLLQQFVTGPFAFSFFHFAISVLSARIDRSALQTSWIEINFTGA